MLTDESAAAYLDVWMRNGENGVDAARVRRDALRARSSRKALARLRYRGLLTRTLPQTPVPAWACRAPRVRVPRCRQNASAAPCKARGRPPRLGGGV